MRRRRKTKYTWLPADGQHIDTDFHNLIVPFTVSNSIAPGANSASPAVVFTNCIADFPQDTDAGDIATTSVADAIGSEYFLKRIVGKCFVEVNCEASNSLTLREKFPTVLVTTGFFIAACDPDDITKPLGSSAQIAKRFSPIEVDAIREPWIWRRSWMLCPAGYCNGLGQFTAGGIAADHQDEIVNAIGNRPVGVATFPPNNAGYGSVADGPHIDAKTARRVRQHERLWVSLSMVLMPEGSTFVDTDFHTVNVIATYDLRALGALRKARNRSAFE